MILVPVVPRFLIEQDDGRSRELILPHTIGPILCSFLSDKDIRSFFWSSKAAMALLRNSGSLTLRHSIFNDSPLQLPVLQPRALNSLTLDFTDAGGQSDLISILRHSFQLKRLFENLSIYHSLRHLYIGPGCSRSVGVAIFQEHFHKLQTLKLISQSELAVILALRYINEVDILQIYQGEIREPWIIRAKNVSVFGLKVLSEDAYIDLRESPNLISLNCHLTVRPGSHFSLTKLTLTNGKGRRADWLYKLLESAPNLERVSFCDFTFHKKFPVLLKVFNAEFFNSEFSRQAAETIPFAKRLRFSMCALPEEFFDFLNNNVKTEELYLEYMLGYANVAVAEHIASVPTMKRFALGDGSCHEVVALTHWYRRLCAGMMRYLVAQPYTHNTPEHIKVIRENMVLTMI